MPKRTAAEFSPSPPPEVQLPSDQAGLDAFLQEIASQRAGLAAYLGQLKVMTAVHGFNALTVDEIYRRMKRVLEGVENGVYGKLLRFTFQDTEQFDAFVGMLQNPERRDLLHRLLHAQPWTTISVQIDDSEEKVYSPETVPSKTAFFSSFRRPTPVFFEADDSCMSVRRWK